MRLTKILLFCLLFAAHPAAFAQDEPEPEESDTPAETAEEEPPVEEEDEVFDTDDEAYIDIDEEDFIPTEEIPTDQSIPFPSDI